MATAACRGSERNKVAFVRALKNRRRAGEEAGETIYGRSTVKLVVGSLAVGRDRCNGNTGDEPAVALMTEVCRLVSVLCRYDDFQPEGAGDMGVDSSYGTNVSSSHDHVLEFSREGIVPLLQEVTLLSLSEGDGGGEEGEDGRLVALAGAALSATRVLAVNDEIVQAMVAVGTLRTIKLALDMGVKEVLETGDGGDGARRKLMLQRQLLTAGAIGLVRNLSGNDEIKTTLCLGTDTVSPSSKTLHSTSVLPAILQGMRLYRTNASIQEHSLGALAAMALRKPVNAMRIVRQDGPREMLTGMRQFPGNVLVQRQGALAIRNIVSRLVSNPSLLAGASTTGGGVGEGGSERDGGGDGAAGGGDNENLDVRDVFLDLGAEVILRGITGRHQGSVDEAYAALRDLDCQVSMVKFDSETQKATSQVAMFGDAKPNFRAVYEESSAMEDAGGGGGDGMAERISERASTTAATK